MAPDERLRLATMSGIAGVYPDAHSCCTASQIRLEELQTECATAAQELGRAQTERADLARYMLQAAQGLACNSRSHDPAAELADVLRVQNPAAAASFQQALQ